MFNSIYWRYASIVITGVHPLWKEKLVGQAFDDMKELASKGAHIEQFIQER